MEEKPNQKEKALTLRVLEDIATNTEKTAQNVHSIKLYIAWAFWLSLFVIVLGLLASSAETSRLKSVQLEYNNNNSSKSD